MTLEDRVERALGARPRRTRRLSGGCVSDVRLCEFAGGDAVVAKATPDAEIEAHMLRTLRDRGALLTPAVLHCEPGLLLLAHVENDGAITSAPSEQEHAGELLAALHSVRPPAPHGAQFGFNRETRIGPLPQPNGWSDRWVEFFSERRLLHFAQEALNAGMIDAGLARRVERFVETMLPRVVDEPEHPSLLHGDAWTGNILVRAGRVVAFIDPAVYYGDGEVDLAFGTLFGTFNERFFEAYRRVRPIRPGFFEARRDVYNLSPLLVHARLFGGGYAAQVGAVLARFGV
jgi:fructosamine-3-kinase